MEAIYYWTGLVVIWWMIVCAGVFALFMGVVVLRIAHKYLKESRKWYRQSIDLWMLPLYVRLALSKSEVAGRFIVNMNQIDCRKEAHLRVLIAFLNYVYSLRNLRLSDD